MIIKETFASALQHHQKNNLKEAENLYKKILEIDPNHFKSILHLGLLSIQIKNFDRAIQLFNKAIEIHPNQANAYHNLGYIFTELGEYKKAITFYQKAIQIQPNYAEAHYNLGNVFKQLGEFQKAKSSYQKAIQIQPNNANIHNNLGNVFKQLGEYQKVITSYQKAIQIQSNHKKAHFNLGNVFKQLGEFKKAAGSYQKALEYEPDNLETLYNLSDLNKKILNSNTKSKIKKILKNKNSTKKNIAYGNFLLSRYELKGKNYEKEFNYLLEGHLHWFESKKKFFEMGINYFLDQLPNVKELFNLNKSYKTNIKINHKIKPIFIIGVPRCGSTIVEKIIASGAKSISIGEETGILSAFVRERLHKEKSLNLNMKNFQTEIIEGYKQKGLIQEKNDYIFTDKSLENFFYISLIKEIFPNAKVINCRRNALSSIMSILKNNLGQVSWAHNLKHIFQCFDIYYRIIENFNKRFPNYIYELQFEKFVNKPEIEAKKLMKFCDLQWDKKCLEFYKRKDLISQTASNIQIRRAIYKDSIHKYLPYKKFLKEYADQYHWFN